ncbi:MAG: tetratricopeptide repeat protein [Acidobacteriota bacterium]
MAWFRARQFDRAERKLREVMDFDPSYARAHNKLAEIYQAQGRYEEAFAELMTFWTQTRRPEAEIAQLQQAFRDGGWQAFSRKQIELLLATSPPPDGHQISKLYLRTGDRAQALVWLEKSFTELGEGPLRIKDPEYDSLRDNPKYQELLRRAGHEK